MSELPSICEKGGIQFVESHVPDNFIPQVIEFVRNAVPAFLREELHNIERFIPDAVTFLWYGESLRGFRLGFHCGKVGLIRLITYAEGVLFVVDQRSYLYTSENFRSENRFLQGLIRILEERLRETGLYERLEIGQ